MRLKNYASHHRFQIGDLVCLKQDLLTIQPNTKTIPTYTICSINSISQSGRLVCGPYQIISVEKGIVTNHPSKSAQELELLSIDEIQDFINKEIVPRYTENLKIIVKTLLNEDDEVVV